MDQTHNAGPWLLRCDQTCQPSLDYSRSLVFNPVQRVSVAIFWSPNGSSASFVSLKPWNHQFSCGESNGWHSAVGNDEHGKRRFVHGSGPSWHSKSVFDRTTLHHLGLSKYYCSILFRDLGAQNDPLVVRRVGYIHFVGKFL